MMLCRLDLTEITKIRIWNDETQMRCWCYAMLCDTCNVYVGCKCFHPLLHRNFHFVCLVSVSIALYFIVYYFSSLFSVPRSTQYSELQSAFYLTNFLVFFFLSSFWFFSIVFTAVLGAIYSIWSNINWCRML